MASLETESVERHGLAGGDYAVLVTLSEAPDERLRMCDLAVALHLSPSGITRRLDGMVKQGLVAREPSTEDRRVMLAVLTPAGRAALEAAAPDHVDAVRRHFLDHLTPDPDPEPGRRLRCGRAGPGASGRRRRRATPPDAETAA